jgi:hypothetical protein
MIEDEGMGSFCTLSGRSILQSAGHLVANPCSEHQLVWAMMAWAGRRGACNGISKAVGTTGALRRGWPGHLLLLKYEQRDSHVEWWI